VISGTPKIWFDRQFGDCAWITGKSEVMQTKDAKPQDAGISLKQVPVKMCGRKRVVY